MAYGFYDSSMAISSSPSQAYRDSLQELINSKFEIASTYFSISEEDTSIPITIPTSYIDVNVRITHMINIDTGVRLGDDWRELIFKDFDHSRTIGKKYFFDNFTWITINSDTYRYPTASTNIRRCNWTLKWYNEKGILIEEPCIVDYVKMIGSAMGTLDGKEVREGTFDRFVYLQANEETLKIKRDQRFFIDDLVFRVTKRDTIGHPGLVELSLDEHQVNKEVDDVVNGIADFTNRPPVDDSDIGTTEQFNDTSTLSVGVNGQWFIYKKTNGVVQPDVYTFSIIGTGASIVSYTGNSIVLNGGSTKGTTFTLRATNSSTLVTIDKTIQLVGMW